MNGLTTEVEQVCKFLLELSSTSSRNAKEAMLRQNDSTALRFFLVTLFDPYLTYGVKKISKKVTRDTVPTLEELQQVRETLAMRKVTGNAAIKLLEDTVNHKDADIRKCLAGIFVKDLKLGADAKTINKVFGNLIPTFELGLCAKFNDMKECLNKELPKGRWAVEPKFDGLRGIIVFDYAGVIQVYSRNGKEMYNTEYITDELKSLKLSNIVFDGEIFSKNWNESIGIAHTQSDHPDKENLNFHIFDVLTFDDWIERSSKTPYLERKRYLENLFNINTFKNLVFAPYVCVNTYEEAVIQYNQRVAEGYEGVVIKDLDAGYPFDRSKAWLKWKPVIDADVRIVGYEAGEEGGKNEHRLGAFICDYEGVETRVGGGFTDVERERFWQGREEMIGKIIQIEGQELTKDGRIRFPEFVRLRIDKE